MCTLTLKNRLKPPPPPSELFAPWKMSCFCHWGGSGIFPENYSKMNGSILWGRKDWCHSQIFLCFLLIITPRYLWGSPPKIPWGGLMFSTDSSWGCPPKILWGDFPPRFQGVTAPHPPHATPLCVVQFTLSPDNPSFRWTVFIYLSLPITFD